MNEQVEATNPVASAPSRPAYKPKPVLLLPVEIIRFIDELNACEKITSSSQSPALEAVALATTSLRNGAPFVGKVLQIEAETQNMREMFENKIRLFEHLIMTVSRLLKQDEEGVEPKVFDTLATIASDIYASMTYDSSKTAFHNVVHPNAHMSRRLSASLPFFHLNCLPALRYLVNNVKSLPHHTRLMVCKIIEEMEKWEIYDLLESEKMEQLESLGDREFIDQNKAVLSMITEITSNKDEKLSLVSKFVLLSSFAKESDSKLDLLKILERFDKLPVSLLDRLFDLLLVFSTTEYSTDFLHSTIDQIKSLTEAWNELDSLILLAKMFELNRVLLCRQSQCSDISNIFNHNIAHIFNLLIGKNSDHDFWSASAALKTLEILIVSSERDIDISLPMDSIPHMIASTKPYIDENRRNKFEYNNTARPSSLRSSFGRSLASKSSNSTHTSIQLVQSDLEDQLLRAAFDYAISCFNSYHPKVLLSDGFSAILQFVDQAFGPELKLDCDILIQALNLGKLFVRQKSDPGSLVSFFQSHMVSSFSIITSWQASKKMKPKQLYMEILDFAYHCIQAGNTNRYKFFCWFLPPIYEIIDHLNGEDIDKFEITSEVVSTCFNSLNKGNDIDLLLRDGIPMVLNLFSNVPNQIPSMMRHVATKLCLHGNFWILLQLNFALETSKRDFTHFASKESVEEFFRVLISKGQRKAINTVNDVLIAHLLSSNYFGIRSYIFASFEKQKYETKDTESQAAIESPEYIVKTENFLNFDQVISLCSILATVFAMDKSSAGVSKIIRRLLSDLLVTLESNKFDDQYVESFRDMLSRVLLFKNLFPQILNQYSEQSDASQPPPSDANSTETNTLLPLESDAQSSSSPPKPQTKEQKDLNDIFLEKFPSDVIRDKDTMSILSILGTRIEKVNSHLVKFQHVATHATSCLNEFFSFKVDPQFDPKQHIHVRRQYMNDYVYNLPQNLAIRNHLLAQGYDEKWFLSDLQIRVDIDDRRNLDEIFKTTLSTLYNEYLDLIKGLYGPIKEIVFEGAKVPVEDFFVENHRTSFSIEDLRSRRNHAIKMIDKKSKSHHHRINLQNRKLSLLTREEALEQQLEKDKLTEGLNPPERRRYYVRSNNSFWNVASCCDKHISGCYAPNGDHAEKGIENSFKQNVAFFSLYEAKKQREPSKKKSKKTKFNNQKDMTDLNESLFDEEEDEIEDGPGLEIENIEVIYTDQGVYVFKLYTNGHNLDTSLAWVQFFKVIASTGLVPAIIIPASFPNIRIYNQLETFIVPEIAGSIITYNDSFYSEYGVSSYYDIPVEKIKQGDLVLNEENSKLIQISGVDLHQEGLKLSSSRSRLVTSTSIDLSKDKSNDQAAPKIKTKVQQDLSGIVLTNSLKSIKSDMQKDPELNPFMYTMEAFVRYISQYLNLYIDKGQRDESLLTVGFDLEQWNRRKQVKKEQQLLTPEIKDKIINLILKSLHNELDAWLEPRQLCKLFVEGKTQFFELQSHWQKLKLSTHVADRQKAKIGLDLMLNLMAEIQTTASFDQLERNSMETFVKWIFGNEDRVWRERGGRPSEETLSTFLNFCRVYEDDPNQLTKAQQQVRLLSQTVSQVQEMGQSVTDETAETDARSSNNSNNAENAHDDSSLNSFKGHHYGNEAWGGFISVGTCPRNDEPKKIQATYSQVGKKIVGSAVSNKDVIAYCIGDYIAKDDFEVVTAWVHPNYRSLGLAVTLYKKTAYRVWEKGGNFVTFDILVGTLEHLTSTVLALKFIAKIGLLKHIIVKRKLSYASETERGVEQFERLTIRLRWLVIAFKVYDFWMNMKKWVLGRLSKNLKVCPWRSWLHIVD